MTTHKFIPLFFTILFSFSLSAQDEVAIGNWRSYLPYTTGKHVTQNPTTVFYAADFSLLAIDKADNSVQRLTKVNGLSDVEIDFLKHSPFDDKMILVYKNGNIDFVSDNGIVNFPFLKDKDIQGDKSVYDIEFVNPNRAFLATGFGILEVNPQTATATNDIRTGIAIRSIAAFEGFFYASTEEGIYRAEDDPSVNLLDFSNSWKLLGADDGFREDYSSRQVLAWDDKLVVDINDSIMFFQNGILDFVFQKNNFGFEFFSAEGEFLIVGFDETSGGLDRLIFIEKNKSVKRQVDIFCISQGLQYAVEDEQGRIWIADLSRQFRMMPDIDSSCDSTVFEGPSSGNLWDLEVTEDDVWVATGGFKENRNSLFRTDGIFRLKEDGLWEQYSRNNRSEFLGEDGVKSIDDLTDLVKVGVDPTDNNKVWFASYFEGLLEYDLETDQMTLFNDKNSGLGPVIGDPNRVRAAGIAFDAAGNTWATSDLAALPFTVFQKENRNWTKFSTSSCGGYTELLDIVVDGVGNKWMRVANSSAGLIVFNEGDLNNPNDDDCKEINSNNSNLPSNDVLSIEVDLDGDVWVGTTDGVVIFQCGSQVFEDGACPGFLQIVNVGGDNELLLKGNSVNAIAVDGANRKWFGTGNGIFLQSESGDELLASFTEINSPLFDNNIIDIDIRQSTGEVFIGTARGLQSIRTDATEGFPVNTANINIFPNPVRPNYFGPIAVKGLARDANVKITDINGQLVYETQALGGQAIWDGNDYNGVRAATGIYLVFSTSTKTFDNPDADMVGKILMIK